MFIVTKQLTQMKGKQKNYCRLEQAHACNVKMLPALCHVETFIKSVIATYIKSNVQTWNQQIQVESDKYFRIYLKAYQLT